MNYKSVIITKKGGPNVLRVVENQLQMPNPDEARANEMLESGETQGKLILKC